MALHPSGWPLKWNGSTPRLYVLEKYYDESKGETPQQGYDKYMQLPFFGFAQAKNFVPLGLNFLMIQLEIFYSFSL